MTEDVIVIDDEENLCRLLEKVLRREGHSVRWFMDGNQALARMAEGMAPRLVITDLRMPEMDGLEVLRRVRADHPGVLVLIMTAHGSVDSAVEAMKLGAFDYLTKPFQVDEIRLVVRRALQHTADPPLPEFVGQSRPMGELFRLIRQAAPVEAGILIMGETGTGKELVAHAIHQQSQRANGPFVKVNCAALPETLLESELFGHEKGAFTGAGQQRPGRFELAHGGTLFLDEIGDIPPATQVRLLRVLQEKEFERVGGTRTLQADVRIVAATHRDLEAAVQAGSFRLDLFYRLHVIPLHIPPLRERVEDIPALLDHFMARFAPGGKKALAPETVRRLLRHPWPGNVRELENLVQRLVVLTPHDVITLDDLPILFHEGSIERVAMPAPSERDAGTAVPAAAASASPPVVAPPAAASVPPPVAAAPPPSLEVARPAPADAPGTGTPGTGAMPRLPSGWRLEELERAMILQTLADVGGRRNAAARRLGISVRTLQYKLKRYGVTAPQPESPEQAG